MNIIIVYKSKSLAGEEMSVTPKDILNKNKSLKKRVDVSKINVEDVTIDDLQFNGRNYEKYINLQSLLENVSSCQISDAFNGFSKRPGTIKGLKPVNNLKVWGRLFVCKTNSDDWGTSALAIDNAEKGDVLFIKCDNDDAAIWGELASTCARDNGIKATAVYGSVRDLDAILHMDFPVFATNFCSNAGSALGLGELACNVEIDGVVIENGDFFFGDESGAVIIPKSLFARTMVMSLEVKLKESKIIDSIADGMTLSEITGLK